MPRTSEPCPYCPEPLNVGTHGRFLDTAGHIVDDWREATWKTCPGCSAAEGAHVFLRFPDAYGRDATRVLNGIEVPENNCSFHRVYRNRRPLHAGERNPDGEQWECSPAGVVRRGVVGPSGTARAPLVRVGGRGGGLDDAPWTEDAARGAVRLQVGMVFDLEGERQLVTHFLRERDPQVRRRFLASREEAGRLTCDACAIDLGKRYGRIFSEVVEVHHRTPLAQGVQRAAVEDLSLLCPTCHRVAHFRQKEPRTVDEVARLVKRTR